MVSRRQVIQIGALAAIATVALGQRREVRVGVLSPRPLDKSLLTPSIVTRLEELGYRRGAGMTLEYRSADDQVERFPRLARELVDARCDIVFAVGPEAAVIALRDARATMPIVFYANEYDPVEKGIVDTLGRPKGSFTGIYVPQQALVAKRLELMRDAIPSVSNFLVLYERASHPQIEVARKAAAAIKVRLTAVDLSNQPYDFVAAFEAGRKAKVDACLMLSSSAFATHLETCIALLNKYRLPAIGPIVFSERGLLLGYGPHATHGTRRAAELGAKILGGAKPHEVPVEQDDKFELVINAAAAKALGVRLPESIRARAIRVVT